MPSSIILNGMLVISLIIVTAIIGYIAVRKFDSGDQDERNQSQNHSD